MLYLTDKVLHSVALPVDVSADHTALLKDMKDCMLAHNGIGLAAPQIGLSSCVAIVHVPGRERLELLNPALVAGSESKYVIEGCLSLPGKDYPIKRFMKVTVRYFDRYGKRHVDHFTGLEAQAVQHELDHLHGKLINR